MRKTWGAKMGEIAKGMSGSSMGRRGRGNRKLGTSSHDTHNFGACTRQIQGHARKLTLCDRVPVSRAPSGALPQTPAQLQCPCNLARLVLTWAWKLLQHRSGRATSWQRCTGGAAQRHHHLYHRPCPVRLKLPDSCSFWRGASTEQRQLNGGEREDCALCPATTLGKALILTLPNFQVLDLAA